MSIFTNINHSKTYFEVAHQIEALILEGVLRVGDRLPGERDLANEMSVSRPILRQAIKRLEENEILESRHGGGTFVSDVIGTVFSPQISKILPAHKKATLDYLDYRKEIEAIAAGFAAEKATTKDKTMLSDLMVRMQKAHEDEDFDLEAEIDFEFHNFIGDMAHNLVLLHTIRSCYRLLSSGIFENRKRVYDAPNGREMIFKQHQMITKTILAGNVGEAQKAAKAHIEYIIEQTLLLGDRQERERVSELRAQSSLYTHAKTSSVK